MNLWHYTSEPFTVEHRSYTQAAPRQYGKPDGLWVSVEGRDDWQAWCEAEDFCKDQLAYRAPIAVRENANILVVTPSEMRVFDSDYAVEWPWGENGRWTKRAIDWRKVADEYDGIIIAPYSWGHRLDLSWYYTWDCASGCIWNIDAIAVGHSEKTPARSAA